MATDPRKPFKSPAPLPLPTPPGSQPAAKEKDKGGAALPLWSSSTGGDKMAGMPMFRGAGQKSNSLLGRLKSLKTKDVAFIGAGLAVLVMAPLAEFLISEGEDPNGTLTQGFAQNGAPFANGSDPSEIGIMGLARGGVPGDSSDVITPLNARDPSSLIMGGTGEQKEPPAASPAEPKRDAPKDNVWDKVVSSAKSGASAATRKVSLPKPGGKLAGAINGLRSLSGGSTGASLKLAAPDSKGLFSAPRNENHLAKTQTPPGYRGAGQRVIAGGSGGNFDGRRGAGGFAGPGGSVAGDVMSGGISGGGRGSGFSGGDGDPTKNPGGNSTKDAKTLGESLAFLRQKMEMEKAIDLKWAKKRYNELERKKMIEQTLVQTAQQAFMKVLDKLLEGKKDGAGSSPGGSPPGGSPPGGSKPEDAKKPNLGAATGTPVGEIGGGNAVAQFEQATKQEGEARRLGRTSTRSINGMESHVTSLNQKAQAAKASSDTPIQGLGTILDGAMNATKDAQAALAKADEAAKKPLKPLGEALKEYEPQLTALEKTSSAQVATVAAVEGLLGSMKEGDKYEKPGEPTAVNDAKKELKPVDAKEQNLPKADQSAAKDAQAAQKAAEAKIDAAITAVNSAYDTIGKHQANAADLKKQFIDALNAAKKSVQGASGDVQTANQAVADAIQKAETFKTAFGKAVTDVNGAVSSTESAATAATGAQSTWSGLVGEKQAEKTEGVTKKTEAGKALATAQGKVKTAKASFDDAKKKY